MKKHYTLVVGALLSGLLLGVGGVALVKPKPAAASCTCHGEELCGAAAGSKSYMVLAAAVRCKKCGSSCRCGAICRCPK